MNFKKLFEAFDKQPIDEVEGDLNAYKDTFRFKIEMFIKVVIYGEQWKDSVVSLFSKSEEDLDIKDIGEVGDFMLYTRAWFWISQFDLEDEECIKDLKDLNDSSLLASIVRSIKYFESTEEFEKCSFLVKIKDLLK
tara:strand:+ start:372 stop:779 length:408 start_codon:yes stop_codon:yes gene_type:complete